MLTPQVFRDHEAVSAHAADRLVAELRKRPYALMCLATGATPMRTYDLLAQRRESEPRLFDDVRILKLDEWGGLPLSDPATCESSLRRALITPLNLAARYTAFDSQPADPVAECGRIAAWLAQNGPLDVCVLGLGLNGHLGFNEPADELQPHSHVATLSDASLSHAMLGGGKSQPSYGLTLGMADILHSRRILLLVTGAAKRAAVAQLLSGRITTRFPASLLALHSNVSLICDEAALSTT